MSGTTGRRDVFSLSGEGRCVEIAYPEDVTIDEVDEVARWVILVATKIKREAVARQVPGVRAQLETLAASSFSSDGILAAIRTEGLKAVKAARAEAADTKEQPQ